MERDAKPFRSNLIVFGAHYRQFPVFFPANDNVPAQDVKTVTVRKYLPQSGVPITVKVPISEFTGVAVATRISENGVVTSSIELVHPDSALNYRVFQEEGNHAVVAEWQNWGKKLCLPLYIRAGNGALVPYSRKMGGVMVGNDTGRREFSSQIDRRPRFLNRRKPGLVSV